MSETKYSSSSSPADSWAHEFYNPNVTMYGGGRDRVSSEATVISTTASGSATSNILSHHGSSSSNTTTGQYLNMPADQGAGGRAPKPIRRRSRASRRTPTTLLNTDTTNFRAMVQQFTGGPAMPYATGSHPQYPFPRGGSNFSFGVESRNQILNPTPSSGAFYQLQLQQQQQQQQREQQQREQQQHEPYYQQQHQPYMFSFMNNSRPDMEDMNNQATGGFSIDHVPFPDLPHPRPPSSMP